MGIFEAAVVFVVGWWIVFLPSLSAGGVSQSEMGDVAPGTEPGAPQVFLLKRKILYATIGAALITALVWLGVTYYQAGDRAG